MADLPALPYPPPTLLTIRSVDWHPNGRRLLYTGAPDSPEGYGPLMLLDLARPDQPRREAERPIGPAAWHPDGASFAYATLIPTPEGEQVGAIFQQRPGEAERRELLAPGLGGPETRDMVQRWLDGHTLAFDQRAGLFMRSTLLLDAPERRLIPTPALTATFFTWSQAGDRLAGQVYLPLSSSFWVWDRRRNAFLVSPEPEVRRLLPGNHQFFEAWAPDGSAVLFSAWDQFPFIGEGRPTLYRLDLETGEAGRVAESAALAAWHGDQIAYVVWGPGRNGETGLTLAMTRAADGLVDWTDDPGSLPAGGDYPWAYYPRFAGPYVAYRTTEAAWRVSPAGRKEVRPIYRGEPVDLRWAPDGRHLSLLHTNETARLLVVVNPFEDPSRRFTGYRR